MTRSEAIAAWSRQAERRLRQEFPDVAMIFEADEDGEVWRCIACVGEASGVMEYRWADYDDDETVDVAVRAGESFIVRIRAKEDVRLMLIDPQRSAGEGPEADEHVG